MPKHSTTATARLRTSRTSGRRERRRTETRERIFRAALRLFAQRGFLNTTVEDITEAADVGKGTFFNYFPSKGHVLQALAEIQLGNVAAALEDAREGQDAVQTVLFRLTKALTREPGHSPALVRSLLMAIHSSDAVRELVTARLASGRELLVELMEIGQRRGEVRRDFHAVELARIFQQQIFGMLMIWTLHPPADLQSWVEQTFDVFWSGIRKT
ncbi:MAG: TetR/AcrR family transcriptional regulator [Candidatus Acidiferrales bacterium]